MFDLSNNIINYILLVTIILLIVVSYYCIKFALIIIKTQENIENCLDEIDDQYNKISLVLETPVFYDSPEVKRVLSEISRTQDSLLYVANKLTNNIVEEKEYEYEEEKD